MTQALSNHSLQSMQARMSNISHASIHYDQELGGGWADRPSVVSLVEYSISNNLK
jgi:hypothetical protein